MAQETRVAPIELNNDASKIMMDLGDSIAKQGMQRDQLDFERRKQQAALLKDQQKNIDDLEEKAATQVTSLTVTPEQMNSALTMIKDNASKARLNGMSVNDLRESLRLTVNNMLMYSNTRKTLDGQVQNVLTNDPDINPSELRKQLQPLTVNDPKSLDIVNNDYAQQIVDSKYGWRVYDSSKSQATTIKLISADKGKQVEAIKSGTQVGNVRLTEGSKVQYDPKFYTKGDDGIPKLRTDENGIIEQSVFDNMVVNKSVNAHLEYKVDKIKNDYKDLSDKDKEAFWLNIGLDANDLKGKIPKQFGEAEHDIIKRSVATTLIKENSPVSIQSSDGKTIVVNNSYLNNQNNDDPRFAAPITRLKKIVELDPRYVSSSKPSVKGYNTYDITTHFKGLNIFKNTSTGKVYGPVEVQYNAGGEGQSPEIYVREKKGKPFKSYTVQQFTDLLVPKTDGAGYDTPSKRAGSPRI